MRATIPEKPITGLWYLLKGYKWLFFGSIICQFIIITIDTSRLFVLRFIVDDVISTIAWEKPLLIANHLQPFASGGYKGNLSANVFKEFSHPVTVPVVYIGVIGIGERIYF